MLDQRAETLSKEPGRALVAVSPQAAPSTADDRPRAEFVAQLIACHRRFAAYRTARRASPTVAVAGYDRGTPAGRIAVDVTV